MNYKIVLGFEDGSEIYSIQLEQLPPKEEIEKHKEFYGAKSHRIIYILR